MTTFFYKFHLHDFLLFLSYESNITKYCSFLFDRKPTLLYTPAEWLTVFYFICVDTKLYRLHYRSRGEWTDSKVLHIFEHLSIPMSIFAASLGVDDLEEALPGGGVGPHPPAVAHAVHAHPDLELPGKSKQKPSERMCCH